MFSVIYIDCDYTWHDLFIQAENFASEKDDSLTHNWSSENLMKRYVYII